MDRLFFRPMTAGDKDEVRALHEKWFPLRYADAFYDGAAKGEYAGKPVINCIATDVAGKTAGIIIISFMSANGCGENDLIVDKERYPRVAYIMTIGVCDAFRRRKVGSRLLRWGIERAASDTSCGALFLHVITWNKAAMRFYARNEFRYVRSYPRYQTSPTPHNPLA
mmetsp:Transcript_40725/g.127413  ORF Transcript_40725/g.127413 Transcript_40725/m.127413 type:complete len:167 (-) Transcript_40725:58-558(-)